jgi:hypothetical protein
MGRWIRFFLAILAGVGLGLAYGWLVSPVRYVDTVPDTLRIDYKTDYVLMVAEAYQADGKLDLAVRRLAVLGSLPPAEQVYKAIQFGQKAGYIEPDLARMQALFSALQAPPPVEAPPPVQETPPAQGTPP